MADKLATDWWRNYHQKLERLFRQEMIVIRAQEMQLL